MNNENYIYSEKEWSQLPKEQMTVNGTLYYICSEEDRVEIRQVFRDGYLYGTAGIAHIRKGASYSVLGEKRFVITIEQSPDDYFENAQNVKFQAALRHVIRLIKDEKILI